MIKVIANCCKNYYRYRKEKKKRQGERKEEMGGRRKEGQADQKKEILKTKLKIRYLCGNLFAFFYDFLRIKSLEGEFLGQWVKKLVQVCYVYN